MQTTKARVCPRTAAAVKSPVLRRRETFDRWVLHSLIATAGWQAVYFDDDTGRHFVGPCHGLALATRRCYDAHSARRLPNPVITDEDEAKEIVGMAYAPDSGWDIIDETANFCGLVPPGTTLAEFESAGGCYHPAIRGEVTS